MEWTKLHFHSLVNRNDSVYNEVDSKSSSKIRLRSPNEKNTFLENRMS